METSSKGALAWSQDRTIVPYPDPAIESHDPRLSRIVSAAPPSNACGPVAAGPRGAGLVRRWPLPAVFDIPNDRILRWSEETGVADDPLPRAGQQRQRPYARSVQGRLVSWSTVHGSHAHRHDGRITVLMDSYDAAASTRRTTWWVHSMGRSGSPTPATAF